MSPDQLRAAIDFVIGDIEDELAGISPLVGLAAHRPLDFIETAAAAQIIQSIYTGIEGLMVLIAKKIDGKPPVGSAWHQLLLEQMAVPSSCRPRLFSEEVMSKLRIYLGFRHMVRHNYSNRLKEDRVRELLLGLSDLWILAKADLESFKNN